MRLTTKGRYAVTALLDIALQNSNIPITVAELSARHEISQAYLERLTGIMRAKGLLKSIKGPGGGYLLGKAAKDISVSDIIIAVEEPFSVMRCEGKSNCHHGGRCLTHYLWAELNEEILDYLRKISLQDLALRPEMIKIAQHHNTINVFE